MSLTYSPLLKADLGIDYGTSSIKITYTKFFDNDPKPVNPISRMFFGLSQTLPADVAWSGNEFYFGDNLQSLVLTGEVSPEDVIQCSKVAIYYLSENIIPKSTDPDFETYSKVVRQLERAGKTIADLLKEHVESIIRMASETIKKDPGTQIHFRSAAVPVPDPVIDVRLTVPQMWRVEATQMMYKALENPLVNYAMVAREPSCAVAAYIDMAKKHSVGLDIAKLSNGATILVNDLGCGTGDIVLYQLRDDKLRLKSRLRVLEHSPGGLCGSNRVNDYVLRSILERLGKDGLSAALQKLGGMSADTFSWKLLSSIEKAKLEYPIWDSSYFPIAMYGTDQAMSQWNLKPALDKATMDTAHRKVIDKIIKMNSKILKKAKISSPSAIVLLGGFSKSSTLQDRFAKQYGEPTVIFSPRSARSITAPDVELLVAHGALSERYGAIIPQNLPSHYSYAFLQDENYRKEKHIDCTMKGKKGRTRRDDSKVVKDEAEKRNWLAPDRVREILKDTSAVGDDIRDEVVRQDYLIDASDPVLEKAFVYIDKGVTFEDGHEGARQAPTPISPPVDTRADQAAASDSVSPRNWKFKDGVHAWVTVKGYPDRDRLISIPGVVSSAVDGVDKLYVRTNMTIQYRGEREVVIWWNILDDQDVDQGYTVHGAQSTWSGKRSEFVTDDADASDAEQPKASYPEESDESDPAESSDQDTEESNNLEPEEVHA